LWPTAPNYQLSTIHYQLSTTNYQLFRKLEENKKKK